MANYAIRSHGDRRFVIWLADCTDEHAQSVYASVNVADFQGPHDLTLEQVERLYELAPCPPSRSRWRISKPWEGWFKSRIS